MSSENPARVWLITGCSSGFGHALAEQVLQRGHRLIATARDVSTLAGLTAQFPETCRALTLDVTNAAQVKSVVAEAASAFGHLDVVVNNAGHGLIGALEECDDEQIWRNFNTNLFGALRVIRAALPITDYEASSGKFAAFLEKMDGSQPGDPVKAAQAIIQITETDRAPLRLVLGKYANDKALKQFEIRRRELEAWKDVGLPTDFA